VAVLRERAGAIVANCNHIHGALTALIRQLRPVGLDDLGLEAALEHCVDTWRPRLAAVSLELAVSGELSDLGEAATLTVYRVVQEGLNNVAKHASARQVILKVERALDLIVISVRDDGVGTDPNARTHGLGLIGMQERLAALDGRLEIFSAPGKGFELKARIPVHAEREAA
jgi:signal transduction histidine kinase